MTAQTKRKRTTQGLRQISQAELELSMSLGSPILRGKLLRKG